MKKQLSLILSIFFVLSVQAAEEAIFHYKGTRYRVKDDKGALNFTYFIKNEEYSLPQTVTTLEKAKLIAAAKAALAAKQSSREIKAAKEKLSKEKITALVEEGLQAHEKQKKALEEHEARFYKQLPFYTKAWLGLKYYAQQAKEKANEWYYTYWATK